MEAPGDVFYLVEWDFEGFGPDDPDWDETCTEDDIERPYFALKEVRVRSVRRPPSPLYRRLGRPNPNPPQVTAYIVEKHLSVDAKGKWLRNPWYVMRRAWSVGKRPDAIRPTKAGAFQAAMAAIRKHSSFDPKRHGPFLTRMKAAQTRARKSGAKRAADQ